MKTAIRLDAGPDNNGNPRRVVVILDAASGNVLDVVDEGYRGAKACFNNHPELKDFNPCTFKGTASERRELLKNFSK